MWHRAQMLQQTQVFFHFYGLIRLCSSFAAFVFYDSFACSMAPNSIHTISTNTNFHSVRDCLTQCHRFFFSFLSIFIVIASCMCLSSFLYFLLIISFPSSDDFISFFSFCFRSYFFLLSFRHLFRYNNLFTM